MIKVFSAISINKNFEFKSPDPGTLSNRSISHLISCVMMGLIKNTPQWVNVVSEWHFSHFFVNQHFSASDTMCRKSLSVLQIWNYKKTKNSTVGYFSKNLKKSLLPWLPKWPKTANPFGNHLCDFNHSRSQQRTDQRVLVLTYIEIFSPKKTGFPP